jgi:hypothetical protein
VAADVEVKRYNKMGELIPKSNAMLINGASELAYLQNQLTSIESLHRPFEFHSKEESTSRPSLSERKESRAPPVVPTSVIVAEAPPPPPPAEPPMLPYKNPSMTRVLAQPVFRVSKNAPQEQLCLGSSSDSNTLVGGLASAATTMFQLSQTTTTSVPDPPPPPPAIPFPISTTTEKGTSISLPTNMTSLNSMDLLSPASSTSYHD